MISDATHDVCNVLNYMGEEGSIERVYTFARHCSNNPALAEKQMEVYRQNYYTSKRGAGAHEGELLGLHFFMSYSEEDCPLESDMTEIARKLAEHPLLRDYASFGANHFDQKHRHTHWYSTQFSAVGKPRKMGLKMEDLKALKRYANYLCYERGYSVIDEPKLRTDPEYSAWIDSVIEEGKVVVHKSKPNNKRRRNKQSTRDMYYKWLCEKETEEQVDYKMLTASARKRMEFDERWYCSVDGDKDKRYFVSGDPEQRFYAVERRTKTGKIRSELECQAMLVTIIADREGEYIRKKNPTTYQQVRVLRSWKLQNMYDAILNAQEMNIKSACELPERIADVGKQMNALRREKSRHEKSLEMQGKIIEAYENYTRIRPLVEGVQNPEYADVSNYKTAYAILAQNQILTEEAYQNLCKRCDFERHKIVDYDRRMPVLNRQYRNLKKLEEIVANPAWAVNEIYRYVKQAERGEERTCSDVDSIIHNASKRSAETGKRVEITDRERDYL